jgi:hypothetical protein
MMATAMRRIARILIAGLAAACAFVAMPTVRTTAADAPAPAASAACAGMLLAAMDDANAVVVRGVDLDAPFGGTIVAYGADRMWTGQIERAAPIDLPYGGHEASVIVRADAPIQGVAYTPSSGTCTFRAVVLERGYFDNARLSQRTLVLGNAQPAPAASCAHPFASAVVKQAVEPQTPANGTPGLVRVAVALDASGNVRSGRILTSPSAVLNASALNAATHSEFAPGVFQCMRVPTAYPFSVYYSG